MSRGPWLSQDQIAEIKALLATGKHTHYYIAAQFSVDRSVVTNIARGKRRTPGLRCICGTCKLCRNREACARYNERGGRNPQVKRDLDRIDAQIERERAA